MTRGRRCKQFDDLFRSMDSSVTDGQTDRLVDVIPYVQDRNDIDVDNMLV